jgi:hypothetical protein
VVWVAKGKYAARADTRLQALESAALQEAHAKIRELTTELNQARHELDVARAQMHGQAMQAAAGMSMREKQNLRNKIASLEHQASEDRVRNAVLTWELMHRTKFDRPSPIEIFDPEGHPRWVEPSSDVHEIAESYDYWTKVHWEVAALFAEIVRLMMPANGSVNIC